MKQFSKYILNIYEINAILLIVGFQFFSFILVGRSGSIIYRAGALFVALLCLLLSRNHTPSYKDTKILKVYLVFLIIFIIRTLYDLYLGKHALTIYPNIRFQCMAYSIGIIFFPILAFYRTYDKIRWSVTLKVLYYLMLGMLLYSLMQIPEMKTTVDGRYNMNSKISTLSFGDIGAYFLILSVALMKFETKKLNSYLYIIGIIVAILSIAKAGSRGPFVGGLMALLFFFIISGTKKIMFIGISLVITLSLIGPRLFTYLETLSPALYQRMGMTLEDGDTGNRDKLFIKALNVFEESPILGSAWVTLEKKEFSSFHNVYIDTFVALGIFGGVFFFAYILRLIFQAFKIKGKVVSIECLFFSGMLVFNFIRGFTGIMLIQNAVFSFVIIGFIISNNRQRQLPMLK